MNLEDALDEPVRFNLSVYACSLERLVESCLSFGFYGFQLAFSSANGLFHPTYYLPPAKRGKMIWQFLNCSGLHNPAVKSEERRRESQKQCATL